MVRTGMVLPYELYGKPSIANVKSSDLPWQSFFVVHTESAKSVASRLGIRRVAVLMCAPSTIGLDHLLSPDH